MRTAAIARTVQSEVYRAGVSGTKPAVPVDGDALERAARKAISAEAFAYLAGGAGAEATMAANRAAFARWQVWPRVLRDVAERDLSIELLGRRRATPFVLSPIGVAELAHADADVAVGRAAAALDVPYVLSNQASRPMEEVPPRWARLAVVPAVLERVRRAERLAAAPRRGVRLRGDRRHPRHAPARLAHARPRRRLLPFTRGQGIAQYTSDPVFAELVRERVARGGGGGARPKVTPTLLASALASPAPAPARGSSRAVCATRCARRCRGRRSRPSSTCSPTRPSRGTTSRGSASGPSLPVLLKGILHPDDASRALDAGVDGIVVSNHGGRQVDRSVATLDALPAIVERVGGRVPVVLDSGVRGGADAFIALALGATAVGIGRPYAYGLAVAGEDGVREVVRNHIAELDITMALAGHRSVAEIGRDSLRAA